MNESKSESLRDMFVNVAVKKKKRRVKKKAETAKLHGRYRFRATIRLVVEYMEWIKEVSVLEETLGADVTKNVRLTQGKRVPERKKLTLKDRSTLLIEIPSRSRETRSYLAALIRNLQPYRKYPESMWDQISAVTGYQYFGPERVLVRQGQTAQTLYYIVRGEVAVSKTTEDTVTGDKIESDMETLGPGDMFGEVALLHAIPRSATVVTKSISRILQLAFNGSRSLLSNENSVQVAAAFRPTINYVERLKETSVDLLTITGENFNVVLRPWLIEQWQIFRDPMVNFNYFKGWDEETMRECCILSKIKDYQPDEVLLGDGKGLVNYVHFILNGTCRVIEHMVIQEDRLGNKFKYKLYNRENVKKTEPYGGKSLDHETGSVGVQELVNTLSQETKVSVNKEVRSTISEMDYSQLMSKRPMNLDMERTSICTLTLRDVVNEWHEITDVAAMLMKDPSSIFQLTYPKNVHTIFMQVCMFYRGACFGLGERMYNRRIVSVTPTRCLLVPRYWLLEHNRANIWERVKLFMDSKYPTTEELFQKFVKNRRWMKHKEELVHHIIDNGRKIPNPTTIHDVPYSVRIIEKIDTA